MPGPAYVAQVADDSTTANTSPETIVFSGPAPTEGNQLVLTYVQARRSTTGEPAVVTYTEPAGWELVASSFSKVFIAGSTWDWVSAAMFTAVSDGTTGDVTFSHSGQAGGGGRGRIYEFAPSIVRRFDAFAGTGVEPTGATSLTIPAASTVVWALGTASFTGVTPPNLNYTVDAGFTDLGRSAFGSMRSVAAYHDDTIGAVPLPQMTDPDAGGFWFPWASVAIALGPGRHRRGISVTQGGTGYIRG